MVLRMKNFDILGVHWKIWLLEVGSQKTNIEGGLPKRGGGGSWTVCWFKGEAWQERGSGVFEGGLVLQCTLCTDDANKRNEKLALRIMLHIDHVYENSIMHL